MQPSEHTAQAINQLIEWCTPPGHAQQRMNWAWFCCQRGLAHPPWIEIARHLFQFRDDQVKTVLDHALQLRRHTEQPLPNHQHPAPFRALTHGFSRAYTPEDILLLAASANGWADPAQKRDPQSLSDRLLHATLTPNAHAFGLRVLGELSLTQMLVGLQFRQFNGQLLALNLQAVDSTPRIYESSQAGQLISAPAAALLQTDQIFNDSLAEVNSLLSRVLQPGAPAIAWSFASLALPGDSVQAFAHIEGDSASAALAYGALYLLRHHLDTTQPLVASLAKHLCTIETPHTVSITAALVPSKDPAQPWPQLMPVDGVPEKLAALASSLPLGRTVSHRFVATRQFKAATVPIQAEGASHLGELVEKIALATTSLNADGRLLHQALQAGLSDAAIAADPALQAAMTRLCSQANPGTGVRAHLVWRYAQLCAGQPSPFGDVARLGQHFVSLNVEGPAGHGDDRPDPAAVQDTQDNAKAQASRICNHLQDILYPSLDEPELHKRWHSVPAWCIQAPPFAGKSTLIQQWELTRIREALREQAQGKGWGEVPVFLPMSAFMRHSRLSQPSADDLGRALRDHAQRLAPALPWAKLLPEQPPTPAQLDTPRPDGLRLRLCIDALNEYRTGQANEGSAIRLLCDWLAPRCSPDRPGALLPPLFSVRREEAANFTLSASHLPGWVAHNIQVHLWRPSQMRAYVIQRGLPPKVQKQLLQALALPGPGATDDDCLAADAQGPANPVAQFSQVPGFLSAQCTLLQRWPHLPISGRRAPLMLALAWHGLDKWRRSTAFEHLQARAATDPALADLLDWLLPEGAQRALKQIDQGQPPPAHLSLRQAGGLLGGLALVADALQDPQGSTPAEAAPWDRGDAEPDPDAPHRFLSDALAPALQGLLQALSTPPAPAALGEATQRLGRQWLAHGKDSGLAVVVEQPLEPGGINVPWLRFAHQQIQEFFSALSVTPQRLPDLTPPPFEVATEELEDHLRTRVSNLELPAVTPHTERLRYAADLATLPGAKALIAAVLNQGNLALAAQLAIDQRARLETPADDSGRVVSHGFWFPDRCNHLLQHLRARLLLASVDTGAVNLPKLHASGILAGIADTVQGLPEPWGSQWAPLLPALRDPQAVPPAQDPAPGWPAPLTAGVDLRQRLHFGLLLGELGDNIRYKRDSVSVEGTERTGILLKAAHWAFIPGSGPGVLHRIGSDRKEDKGKNNHPAWTVPDGELPPTLFAHSPAVVMQWQAFWEDPLAQGKPMRQPKTLSNERFSNPLQPITNINWFTAQAFTAWAAPLHQPLADRLLPAAPGAEPSTLRLPTEVQHEAAVRFDPAQPSPKVQGWWPHDASERSEPGDLPVTLFNHYHTGWNHPAPVGVFSAALSPSGIEAMGNVWTWCSNLNTKNYRGNNRLLANRAVTVETVAPQVDLLALRGGSFSDTADCALAAFRGIIQPHYVDNSFGLRWQMSRPIS